MKNIIFIIFLFVVSVGFAQEINSNDTIFLFKEWIEDEEYSYEAKAYVCLDDNHPNRLYTLGNATYIPPDQSVTDEISNLKINLQHVDLKGLDSVWIRMIYYNGNPYISDDNGSAFCYALSDSLLCFNGQESYYHPIRSVLKISKNHYRISYVNIYKLTNGGNAHEYFDIYFIMKNFGITIWKPSNATSYDDYFLMINKSNIHKIGFIIEEEMNIFDIELEYDEIDYDELIKMYCSE